MKKLIFIASAFLACLSACSGGGADGKTSSPETGGQKNSPIIDNEDMTPGLKGTDADHNGIRDDIDRLISQKYSATPEMKRAAEQEARALQRSMEATTRDQSRVAGNEIMRAHACLRKAMPDIELHLQFAKEAEALTANTKERFAAYWKSEELAGGMVFLEPTEPVCD